MGALAPNLEAAVKILASQDGGLDRGRANLVMNGLIKRYPRFDGVVALNDEMMIGAIMAMHEAGITPSKKVTVSSDVIPDAISLLREGELAASVDPRFDQQTSRALRSLVDYIRDQRKPAEKIVLTKGELVTKATVSAPGNPR